MIAVVCDQLVGNVHSCQQLCIGDAQISCSQCQLVVYDHLVKAGIFGFGVNTVYHIHQHIIDQRRIGDPVLVANSGAKGLCSNSSAVCCRGNADLILTGNTDADGLTSVQCLVQQDVLYQRIHTGVGVHNQIGQILLCRERAFLTGDGGVFCNSNHSALIDIVCIIDRVGILCGNILVHRQGHPVAVGHLHWCCAGCEAVTKGHGVQLGCVRNGVDNIFRQFLGKRCCSAIIVICTDRPIC